jgi:hypothetical protein
MSNLATLVTTSVLSLGGGLAMDTQGPPPPPPVPVAIPANPPAANPAPAATPAPAGEAGGTSSTTSSTPTKCTTAPKAHHKKRKHTVTATKSTHGWKLR